MRFLEVGKSGTLPQLEIHLVKPSTSPHITVKLFFKAYIILHHLACILSMGLIYSIQVMKISQLLLLLFKPAWIRSRTCKPSPGTYCNPRQEDGTILTSGGRLNIQQSSPFFISTEDGFTVISTALLSSFDVLKKF